MLENNISNSEKEELRSPTNPKEGMTEKNEEEKAMSTGIE
jgi:hypothetical protein